MQYEVEVNGQIRQVTVKRRDGGFVLTIGDREWVVDAAPAGAQVLSLLVDQPPVVLSREVSIATDPVDGQLVVSVGPVPVKVGLSGRRRWGRTDEDARSGTGPQRIVAPMPGKIVRVLAAPGTTVQARQPVVVIEAMKMENELRCTADGVVSDVLVREGQSVDAGTLLAIVTPA